MDLGEDENKLMWFLISQKIRFYLAFIHESEWEREIEKINFIKIEKPNVLYIKIQFSVNVCALLCAVSLFACKFTCIITFLFDPNC